jgi:hypothetical protein
VGVRADGVLLAARDGSKLRVETNSVPPASANRRVGAVCLNSVVKSAANRREAREGLNSVESSAANRSKVPIHPVGVSEAKAKKVRGSAPGGGRAINSGANCIHKRAAHHVNDPGNRRWHS